MLITNHTVVSRSNEIIATQLDDKLVMMSISQGEYYSLEPVATRIWGLIENPTSIKDLCRDLVSEFDVSAVSCEQDVIFFIEKLLKMEIAKIGND